MAHPETSNPPNVHAERNAARLTTSPLRRLLPYHTRYFVPFWVGMCLLVIARVFEAGVPYFLLLGIDGLGGQPLSPQSSSAQSALLLPTLGILLCVAMRFGAIVIGRRLIRRIGVSVAYDLRKRVYGHLQRQDQGFYARFPTGDLMARAINDINLVRQLIGGGLRTLIVITGSAIIGFGCMLILTPSLALLLLLPLPIISLTGWRMARTVFARSKRVQEGFSQLSEQVQENLNGIRTVQALVQERREIERFDAVNLDYTQRFYRLVAVNSWLGALMPWLGAWVTAIILGVGGALVLDGEMTVGTFTAFFTYAAMVLWPVRQAGQLITLWQQGASGCSRLFELLDYEPAIRAPTLAENAAPLRLSGAVSISSLCYRYPGAAAPTLRDLQLDITPGETVAVLGRVGSGKSTLLKCFVRLLDASAGSLALDGRDIRTLPLEELRERVVLVPQEPFLFADSLRANLSYDQPQRNEAPIWRALARAALKNTVEQLPQQLDTVVGERGVTLSGGQKQRGTLARGLIREPDLLLLDDCFSSVDTETEETILAALADARRKKTTVIVSHRVSTARHADRIVVLEAGQILEQGTHAQLLARNGWYAELEQLQRKRGDDRGD